jgi:hypothetical protein
MESIGVKEKIVFGWELDVLTLHALWSYKPAGDIIVITEK